MQDSLQQEQQQVIRQRIPLMIIAVIVVVAILVIRLVWFQFPQSPRVVAEFAVLRRAGAGSTQVVETGRGHIYDRNGNPLAKVPSVLSPCVFSSTRTITPRA